MTNGEVKALYEWMSEHGFKKVNKQGEAIMKQALEKQIAKAPEPQERTNRYNEPVTEWFCPTCGCLVDKDDDVYCSYCGQRLSND